MSKYHCKNEPALLVHWVQEHGVLHHTIVILQNCAQIPALQRQQGVYFLCRKLSHLLPTWPCLSLSLTHTQQLESLNEKKGGEIICVKYQWSAQSIMWVWLPGSCGAAECPPLWLLTTQATSLLPMTFPVLLCGCSGSGSPLLNPYSQQHSVLRDLWSILDASKHTVSLSNWSLFIRNQCMVQNSSSASSCCVTCRSLDFAKPPISVSMEWYLNLF